MKTFVLLLSLLAAASPLRAQAPAPQANPIPLTFPKELGTFLTATTKDALTALADKITAAHYQAPLIDWKNSRIEAERPLDPAGRTPRKEKLIVWLYRDAAQPSDFLYVFADVGRFSQPMGNPDFVRYRTSTDENKELQALLSDLQATITRFKPKDP